MKRYDGEKEQRAAARRAHFAKGGDTRGWRGRSTQFSDRKKDASRKACRGGKCQLED